MKRISKKRICIYHPISLVVLEIVFLLTLVGCLGPSDIGMLMRGKPTEWNEESILSVEAKGIDPIDTAEELGKSLKLEITRNNRYAVALISKASGGGWGSAYASPDAAVSMSGEVQTTVIGVSIQPVQKEKQDIYIKVYVRSNTVEARTEAQKVMSEFKDKLTEQIRLKQAETAKKSLKDS